MPSILLRFIIRLQTSTHVALDSIASTIRRPPRSRLAAAGAGPLHGDRGQATTEYALVLLAAALVGLLVVAWATAGGGAERVGRLFNRVLDSAIERVRARGGSGQAAVEFAIVLPVALVAVLGVVQVGLALRNELAVNAAAREGARAAAVTTDMAGAATEAASANVGLPIEIAVSATADAVTVTATYVDDTDVAIIGAFIGPVTHTASVTMALEPP